MASTLHPYSELPQGCVTECRACTHRMMSQENSLQQKHEWLLKTLAPWASQISIPLSVSTDERWNYREKVCLSAAWQNNHWHFGFKNHERQVIPIHDCPVHHPKIRKTIQLLIRHLPPFEVFPLAFYQHSGAQITLIVKTKAPLDLSWINERLTNSLSALNIEGLWVHHHPSAGRVLFTKRGWHLAWGKPRSLDHQGLWYGPSAFQQLLPSLAQQAIHDAKSFFNMDQEGCIVDLYCGNGSTLHIWECTRAKTIGVELSKEAVECARHNAPASVILQGKCEDRLPQLTTFITPYQKTGKLYLYVNPPRTGLEPIVRSWITQTFQPDKIAYLSCSAGTLRRDLETLTSAGYRVEHIFSYDFFPQTYHIETLVLLARHDH